MSEFSKAIILKKVKDFVWLYGRLPYQKEDSLVFEDKNSDGEVVERPLRALPQLKSIYGDIVDEKLLHNLLSDLMKKDYVNFETIAILSNIDKSINMELLMSGERKSIEPRLRRKIHNFLGYDLYKKQGECAIVCEGCTKKGKKCGMTQEYWVEVIKCPQFKKKS